MYLFKSHSVVSWFFVLLPLWAQRGHAGDPSGRHCRPSAGQRTEDQSRTGGEEEALETFQASGLDFPGCTVNISILITGRNHS